jgi:hypothetical protein
MLHDVGKLILAAHRPDELAALLAAAGTSGRPLHAIERERTGVTHAEIGAYLLTLWGLPPRIIEAVAHHHAPTRLETTELDPVAAVHIANLLIAEQQNRSGNRTSETLDEDYIAALGVAGRLGEWRTLAAEYVGTAEGEHRAPGLCVDRACRNVRERAIPSPNLSRPPEAFQVLALPASDPKKVVTDARRSNDAAQASPSRGAPR